jgi:hypothetical protein
VAAQSSEAMQTASRKHMPKQHGQRYRKTIFRLKASEQVRSYVIYLRGI